MIDIALIMNINKNRTVQILIITGSCAPFEVIGRDLM